MLKTIIKSQVLFFLILFTANVFAQVSIVGTFKNAPPKAKIYLFQHFGTSYYVFDSATVVSGKFEFVDKNYPNGFYELGSKRDNIFQLIIANEKINLTGDWKNFKTGTKIIKSKENEAYRQMISFNTKLSSFEKKVGDIEPFKTKPEVYNAKLNALQKKYDSINTAFNTFKSNIIVQQTPLFFSKVMKMFSVDENTLKENFFSEAEKNDTDFIRGDMMFNKVAFYLQKFGKGDEKAWRDEAQALASTFQKGSLNQALIYVNLVQVFLQNQLMPDKWLTEGLKNDFSYLPAVQEILSMLPKPQPEIGDQAPDIVLNDIQGNKLALSSLKGKVVLIDFWASWCGPCRMENPNVVNTYNQYKEKGFTVYSVSLDNNKPSWMNAIEKDGLTWSNHVSDLKGWQSAGAALYQVKGIPATFLLDKDGIIIAKNLRGAALQQKLSEILP
jgi:peroxiredoxin